jgi:hypothetical protein
LAERKLESDTVLDNSFRFDSYPLPGFSLRFISGPEMTKNLKKGWWLHTWDTVDGKRRFAFDSQKVLVFPSKEAATAAKEELQKAVDIITEVAE